MIERTPSCPTCEGDIGEIADHSATNVVDQYCDTCSALLRLRFFRGSLVDIEDLDWRADERTD